MVSPGIASNATRDGGVSGGGLGHSNSPLPYLFGGLGLMMGLITIALMILACSYRKSSSNSATDHADEDKSAGHDKQVEMQTEMEPKIVVIMAGDDNPSYLAKPVSCTFYHQQTEQVL
ncbi:hypothetical protein CICLE_v10013138mg [Citrus x clementina]|uniref:Uncharacterized protein n=1 Tax=Citrus clementina TaxID=85681 RepID=V4S9F4_CITCL|nr:protein GLUTAMINE DUMPER 6 [Citrus x clementina]ESR44123.1 hypothetical protein CICLE_v10013138mg [Citrus x clementina]